MPTRRTVLLGGLLTLVTSTPRRAIAALVSGNAPARELPDTMEKISRTTSSFPRAEGSSHSLEGGCLLSATMAQGAFVNGSQEIYQANSAKVIAASGDRDFDRALAQTLLMLSNELAVLPGFGYYDDGRAPNAQATSARLLGRDDGTVLFGLEFLRRLMTSGEDHPEIAVAAVCAHEFGHITQYKYGLIGDFAQDPTVKRAELQADFLAGYFAGRRKLMRADFPAAVVALAQYNLGDTQFTHRGHHGTHEERGRAVERGFVAAYREKADLSGALAIARRYARSL